MRETKTNVHRVAVKTPEARAESRPVRGFRQPFAAKCCVLFMLQAASMTFAADARAQVIPCDQLESELVARIDASGARGYTLEAVPAGAPVPPGAQVIGTCQAGASKILYRRGGAARRSSGGAAAAGQASAAQAVKTPAAPASPSTSIPSERAVPPVPASTPSPMPQAISRSPEAAPAITTPGPDLEKPASATHADAVRTTDRAAALPAPLKVDETLAVEAPSSKRASEFIADFWIWILALVLVPVAGWIWRARRSGYDEAGLPRGPKL